MIRALRAAPRRLLVPPPVVQRRLYALMRALDEVLRGHDIPYWLESGGLLGLVRDGALIPWDDDLDIAIPLEHEAGIERVRDALRAHGLDLNVNLNRIVYRDDPRSRPPPQRGWRGLPARVARGLREWLTWSAYPYVDIAWKRDHGDHYRFAYSWYERTYPGESLIYKHELHPIRRARLGPVELSAPARPEPYLERAYAAWRRPRISAPHGAPRVLRGIYWLLQRTPPR